MRLTLLGTGSPTPSARRASASFLVDVGGDGVLLDHGAGAFARLIEAGRQPSEISHVVFSHLHFDHCADLVRLFFHRWDLAGPDLPPLKIYGPVGTRAFVERLFGPAGAFALDLTARTQHPISQRIFERRGGVGSRPWPRADVTEIDEDATVEGRGWRLRFAEVPHHQPYLMSYGMRLEADGAALAYSSDVSLPPQRGFAVSLRRLADNADLLLHYFNHFEPNETPCARDQNAATPQRVMADLAATSGVRTLVACHMGPDLDLPSVERDVTRDVAHIFSGRFIWGQDLMHFDLPDLRDDRVRTGRC